MNCLSNVIYPSTLCDTEELYFRKAGKVQYLETENVLYIEPGATVDFSTYFNSFSLLKWRQYTFIEDFCLDISGEGIFIVELFCMKEDGNDEKICEGLIDHNTTHLQIEIPSKFYEEVVYFKCSATEKSILKGAFWGTKKKRVREVNLGLSITTFNRQEAVQTSTSRIRDFLKNTNINAHLLVIDNGNNITIEEDSYVTLVPNENLGGSGGFARGLYYFREEQKDFTHCLFMDDDASCEPESIYRTYQLLSYTNDEKMAIVGALLLGEKPSIQWENGAVFNEYCRPIKSGLNLAKKSSLLKNEIEEKFDYGGWWFFAFPIAEAEYPYPFFVRGDDVNYGLQKQFRQITINGICTWGDDFFYKESPLTQYLDIRSHLLHHLQVKGLNQGKLFFFKIIWRFILRYSLMYRYASAEAQIEGIKDVLKGPSFWEYNINMKEIFPKITPISKQEQMKKIDLNEKCGYVDVNKYHKKKYGNFLHKIIIVITLNGHLMPQFMLKAKCAVVEKTHSRFRYYFLRQKVCVYHAETQEGMILYHDKKRFFSLMKETLMLSMKIIMKHKELKKAYQEKYQYLTSKEYWERQFFKKTD